MKQSGNGGQGQAHCIKRNSKSFFMCRTASWRSASKLESTLLATIPLFPQNFSISIYRAGMTLGAVGICFHVVLLGEGITCLHYIINTLNISTNSSTNIFSGFQRTVSAFISQSPDAGQVKHLPAFSFAIRLSCHVARASGFRRNPAPQRRKIQGM